MTLKIKELLAQYGEPPEDINPFYEIYPMDVSSGSWHKVVKMEIPEELEIVLIAVGYACHLMNKTLPPEQFNLRYSSTDSPWCGKNHETEIRNDLQACAKHFDAFAALHNYFWEQVRSSNGNVPVGASVAIKLEDEGQTRTDEIVIYWLSEAGE